MEYAGHPGQSPGSVFKHLWLKLVNILLKNIFFFGRKKISGSDIRFADADAKHFLASSARFACVLKINCAPLSGVLTFFLFCWGTTACSLCRKYIVH